MTSVTRMCYLQCIKTRKMINLPNQKLLKIGRNEETGVSDVFLSKNQLECLADCENCCVKIKPIGKCVSGCNGYALMNNKWYTLNHRDRVELRLGYHGFDIIFDPSPDSHQVEADEIVHKPKKIKLEFPIFNIADNSKKAAESSSNYLPLVGKWEDVDGKDLLIYSPGGCKPQTNIAAFDIDGTIIKTKSGARFPKDPDDWVLNFSDIPKQLTDLYEDDYKIVFFTNQSGVGKDSSKIKDYKRKIENVVAKISLPIQVFVATGKTMYRKPIPGMWSVLNNIKNDDVPINMDKSFYVGDAAGRDKKWAPKKNKDHSMADRLFAMNIGLKFFTPEEYFLKSSPVSYNMPEFDPRNIGSFNYPDIIYNKQNVILMVGGPGSGKSYYCKNYLIPKGYTHVNRDTLGSWQKCVKLLEESLQKKENVIIDNTNPDKKSRERFLDVARKYGVECRCFLMATAVKHSKHNNKFRELVDKSHVAVSDIIINTFKKNFQEPELSEGFTEIVHVPFVPKFDNPEYEKLYKMFLLES